MTDATTPTRAHAMNEELVRRIVERRTEFFWIGVAMVIIGALAIFFPVIATLTVEFMVGWLLLLFGLVTFFSSFRMEGTGPFFGTLLLSLLEMGLGVYLLTHPAIGVVSLTLLLAAIFLVEGAVQISFAFEMSRHQSWIWMLLSGLFSIAVGLIIAAGLPGISLIALGLVVGINFVSTGIAFILLSQSAPEGVTREGSVAGSTSTSTQR